MKRVALFYISDAGGHSKAAENIREAFEYKYPSVRISKLNALAYFYPRAGKMVDFTYMTVIKHMPHLWRSVYDRRDVIKSLSPVQKLVNLISFRKLKKYIEQVRPDCFVTTQAFPCGVIADYKQKHNLKVPLIAVVTDYYPHRFWIHPQVDAYVVACQEAKKILERAGVPAEKIRVYGIPVSLKFMRAYPRKELAHTLGFAPVIPTILLMGGGLGVGPLKKIAQELDSISESCQILAVCGKNKRLYKWFMKNKHEFHKPIHPTGYIEYIHQLMDCCDIIVTKAGGITVSESLAKGMALIITSPIPGQEERNVKYLVRQKAAIAVDEPEQIRDAVQGLLRDRRQMYLYKERAKAISLVDASLRIVDLVMEKLA